MRRVSEGGRGGTAKADSAAAAPVDTLSRLLGSGPPGGPDRGVQKTLLKSAATESAISTVSDTARSVSIKVILVPTTMTRLFWARGRIPRAFGEATGHSVTAICAVGA